MAKIIESKKACAVNPLKMSSPLGASYAFMGFESCMPVMHGSQGCTSFGIVLMVRHFKEAIPLQTTAMNEATTIMGGYDNVEKALLNIRSRNHPAIIGLCSTGLTETKGDDVLGYIATARKKHPELNDTAIVYVSTPDYIGAFQDGWAATVTAMVEQIEPLPGIATAPKNPKAINVLPGCHLTPGDLEHLRDLIEAFGLQPTFVPDVSGSLDGHIPDQWLGTTIGGTPLSALQAIGAASHTLAIGEQMRPAAEALQRRYGVPYTLLERLTGLTATDALVQQLSLLSGQPVPQRIRRQRSQLVDAMLDGHFHFGNARIALAAEPDLLLALGLFLHEMGAELAVCVTTAKSPVLAQLPTSEVVIGDLEDFERAAQATACDLLMTHAHGRQAAQRLGKPLLRAGIPSFDRIGNAHKCWVGYVGTRNFVYEVGNVLIEQIPHHGPDSWPLPPAAIDAAARPAEVHLPPVIGRLRPAAGDAPADTAAARA